jgi:hypothetical protein
VQYPGGIRFHGSWFFQHKYSKWQHGTIFFRTIAQSIVHFL